MSEPASVYQAMEPKSSIEASMGASATPKGEPAVAVKLYFHLDNEDSLRNAEELLHASFQRMRTWAAKQRAEG